MPDLRQRLKEEIIFLDGATGTNLQRAGMPTGVCPELWILEHPDVLLELQRGYVQAGSQILYAPTFSGNAIKLGEYGAAERLTEINQSLVALSRQAAGADCLVAGNLTMTGRALKPAGDMEFEELVDCYKEQARAIAGAGADLFVIETMMSIQECRAAVLAVKETTELPVFVTVTLEENGRMLYGTDPVTALITMEALGVDAFGINCSCGPDALVPVVREMADYARIPLIAKPNAGLPKLVDGKTVYDMPKEAFAAHMRSLVEAGASIVGGCCGTDASYIAAVREAVRGIRRDKGAAEQGIGRILTSERDRVEISLDGPLHIVGERINPTGKKKLQAQLREGSLELVEDMAREQEARGASVLDINVGMGGIDEQSMMLAAIQRVGEVSGVPLCIDSSDPAVTAAALRQYPGRALVNSISCERVKIEELLPIVKKYGAMFILLPLSEEGMPKGLEERWENIQYVWKKARELGFSREDIVVDALVAAIAAEPEAARDTLATIERCRREGFATICGLSNISFGLPDRSYLNSVFLAMAVSRGLTMAIANPSQELFLRSRLASDLLMGRENAALRYVESCQNLRREEAAGRAEIGQKKGPGEGTAGIEERQEALLETIRQDVLRGRGKQVQSHIQEALEHSADAFFLLNQVLIPAINEVGRLFNEQKYFLPQLMISAKAMESGVAVLEPVLRRKRGDSEGPTVVLATVKGDIHDIGKNLVAMMMKNYGFRVIDLGKDVGKEAILAAAREHGADVIGLSALMTTTMSYMKEVIAAVKEEGLPVKVIVGGAAVTPEYAREIGADGYSADAVEAVELVKRLTVTSD